MEKLIIPIIFLVIIIAKAVRSAQEQSQAGKDSADGWWEEETPSSSPSPSQNQSVPRKPVIVREASRPRPEPSNHVQEILRHLQQQAQPVSVPTTKARPAPAPAPAPEPAARQYFDEARVERELTQAAQEVAQQAVSDVYKQSFGMAFPAEEAQGGAVLGANQRLPIRVRVLGRVNLRRAVLISEILGAPRAFDV